MITSWQCDSRIADAEFLFTKNQYIQKTGRVRGEDDVIAYHLRQSFVPGEITPEEANRLGCELVKRFTKGNHAYIVCTHIDKAHTHNHIIWNSTALSQTRKFRNFWGSTRAVRRLNDTICIENGYSIVENPKSHGKSYNKWLGNQKKPSYNERIRMTIDEAMAQNPESFEYLLELLRQAGYEIKGGKVPSLFGGEQKRFIRMDTLGADYTPEVLRSAIAGERTHTPRKQPVQKSVPTQKSGTLLVDIQTKLLEGKGAGYARWATLFNLKQMAQTGSLSPCTTSGMEDCCDLHTRALKGQLKQLINSFYIEQTSMEPDWDNLQIIHAWGSSSKIPGIYYNFCVENGFECLTICLLRISSDAIWLSLECVKKLYLK